MKLTHTHKWIARAVFLAACVFTLGFVFGLEHAGDEFERREFIGREKAMQMFAPLFEQQCSPDVEV